MARARAANSTVAAAWLLGVFLALAVSCSDSAEGTKEGDTTAAADGLDDVAADIAGAEAAGDGQGGDGQGQDGQGQDGAVEVSQPIDSAADSVVETACPVAVIKIAEGGEVVPGTILHAKGEGSHSASGAPVGKYFWTIKQPLGSNQPLLPNNKVADVELQAMNSGEYEFCLDVWDNGGWKSCQSACETVLVIPNDVFHIELTWDTPKDADQTDSGPGVGADLDLQMAHPLASQPDQDCDGKPDPWFDNPWTLYWFNPAPNWGGAGSEGNPNMDLDDTDGAGPESINLGKAAGSPAAPMAYSIGVHYAADHGFGPSYATLSIYLSGGLAVQIVKVKMNALDMWYAGKLNWPNSMSGGSAKVFETCYQSGLSCKAGKSLMWQPKGEWCITPCYLPPENGKYGGVLLPGAVTCTAGP